jgi:hypothetical protein
MGKIGETGKSSPVAPLADSTISISPRHRGHQGRAGAEAVMSMPSMTVIWVRDLLTSPHVFFASTQTQGSFRISHQKTGNDACGCRHGQ